METPCSAAKRRKLRSAPSSPARTLSTSPSQHEKEETSATRWTRARWACQQRTEEEEDEPGAAEEHSQQATRDTTPDNAHESSTTTMWPQRPKFFPRHTSLVLIGIRGSGLSSLAVIAAKALRFRILNVKSCFASDHGKQRNEYAQAHGWKACRIALVSTLKRLMKDHPSGAILVCGPEVLDRSGQKLLWDFASSHPVIMISRDLSDIQHHLGLSGKSGADHVLRKSAQVCRQVSNMEFYNLPERIVSHTPISAVLAPMRSSSTATSRAGLLQNVKKDFVQFLNTAMPTPGHVSSQLLCPHSPEFREFSNAMRLPLSDCVGDLSNFGTLGCASDAVELIATMRSLTCENKFDFDVLNRAFQLVRRVYSVPVIFHVEVTEEELRTDMGFYSDLVRHGARLLPEFITIDLGIPSTDFAILVSQLACCKIIGHRDLHADESSPWDEARVEFDKAVSLGCGVVRLVGHANSPLDDRRCSEFQAIIASASQIPLIAVNVGTPVQASALSNHALTPVWPQDPINNSVSNHWISSQKLMQVRFQSYMYQPLQFYIIGASVSYSLSPTLHNAGFEYAGMHHVYSAKETENIETIKALVNDSYGGASISLPFKTAVLPFLESVSEACDAIQAVNTILPIRTSLTYKSRHLASPLAKAHKNRAGPVVGLHGENTDWVALYACIARHLSPANEPTENSSALVIGAGGMARASVYALHKSGVSNVVVWNRTFDKANSLANHFNKLFSRTDCDDRSQNTVKTADQGDIGTTVTVLSSRDSPWPSTLAQPSIIICTIPAHKVNDAPPPNFTIPQQWFNSRTGGLVIELSYKTRWTPLLEQVVAKRDQGWNFVEPLEVLIEQGCAQFELFTGCPAPRNYITEKVVQAYQLRSS